MRFLVIAALGALLTIAGAAEAAINLNTSRSNIYRESNSTIGVDAEGTQVPVCKGDSASPCGTAEGAASDTIANATSVCDAAVGSPCDVTTQEGPISLNVLSMGCSTTTTRQGTARTCHVTLL